MLSTEIGLVVLTGTIVVVLLIFTIVIFIVRYNNQILKLEIIKQKQLLEAEIHGKEAEQNRIASEIHDALGSNLVLINLLIQGIGSKTTDNDELKSELRKMKDAVEDAHQNIRKVSKNLMAHDIEVFGLSHSLKEYFTDHSDNQQSALSFETSGEEPDLPIHKKVAIFRIIQELLTNAIKHSLCTIFSTNIKYNNNDLVINIEFDGKSFDFEKKQQDSQGLGLRNILSRIQYLEAILEYNHSDSRNFYLITIPGHA